MRVHLRNVHNVRPYTWKLTPRQWARFVPWWLRYRFFCLAEGNGKTCPFAVSDDG